MIKPEDIKDSDVTVKKTDLGYIYTYRYQYGSEVLIASVGSLHPEGALLPLKNAFARSINRRIKEREQNA